MKHRLIKRKLNRSVSGEISSFIFIILLALFMALPMMYAISNAFKPFDELFVFPPRFFVRNPTLDNFRDLFAVMSSSWVPFSRNIFNTVFVTAAGTVLHILFSSLAAYALSKFDFPGRELAFKIIVLSLMFSPVVTAIPNYIIMAKLHMIDTYWSLILPAVQSSLGLYLMKQFMESLLPDSLLEAARIDGARETTIFLRMVMPIVRPAWLTLAILSIQSLWGATGGVFIYSEELKTLPVALNQIIAGGIARSGVGAAVSVLMMTVPIFIFIVFQNQIIETMATSGMKD